MNLINITKKKKKKSMNMIIFVGLVKGENGLLFGFGLHFWAFIGFNWASFCYSNTGSRGVQ